MMMGMMLRRDETRERGRDVPVMMMMAMLMMSIEMMSAIMMREVC